MSTAEATPTTVVRHAARWWSSDPTPTLMPQEERIDLFEDVWWAVKEYYVYPDYNGVDWEEIYEEYRPRARKARDVLEYYTVLREMVLKLDDNHSYYYTPWEVDSWEDLSRGTNFYQGMQFAWQDEGSPTSEGALVLDVLAESPAAQVGIKRRDRLLSVNREPIETSEDEDLLGLDGPWYEPVTVTVKSPGAPPRELTFERERVWTSARPHGNRLEADKSIGYFYVPDFETYKMGVNVEAELSKLLAGDDLEGLVMDLRSNPGGRFVTIENVLAQFVGGPVGRFYRNDGETYPLDITFGNLYRQLKDVPLVVLVDQNTHSAAEITAAVLQAEDRAQVVGTTSAGNTEGVYDNEMDDGSLLFLAEATFKLFNGTNLEGKGVVPDVTVDVDWTQYSERDDPQILKAIELLRARK